MVLLALVQAHFTYCYAFYNFLSSSSLYEITGNTEQTNYKLLVLKSKKTLETWSTIKPGFDLTFQK